MEAEGHQEKRGTMPSRKGNEEDGTGTIGQRTAVPGLYVFRHFSHCSGRRIEGANVSAHHFGVWEPAHRRLFGSSFRPCKNVQPTKCVRKNESHSLSLGRSPAYVRVS